MCIRERRVLGVSIAMHKALMPLVEQKIMISTGYSEMEIACIGAKPGVT